MKKIKAMFSIRCPNGQVVACGKDITVGRSALWQCENEKRCSRLQCTLTQTEFGVCLLARGVNPIVIFPVLVPEPVSLTKGQSYQLLNGDKFSLFPGGKKYELMYKEETCSSTSSDQEKLKGASDTSKRVEKLECGDGSTHTSGGNTTSHSVTFKDLKRKYLQTGSVSERPAKKNRKEISVEKLAESGSSSSQEIGNFFLPTKHDPNPAHPTSSIRSNPKSNLQSNQIDHKSKSTDNKGYQKQDNSKTKIETKTGINDEDGFDMSDPYAFMVKKKPAKTVPALNKEPKWDTLKGRCYRSWSCLKMGVGGVGILDPSSQPMVVVVISVGGDNGC
eukprot:TRINITY_DN3017_c0_g1_i6.p2 TRINITY_DN3017_c0_g1~~TRINITY_DN3017_c0_g1_i6.p2  ORF type:complete len:333 (-),score=75.81 TRINITY_DN3017_c0_g1_i6:2157-3155(-)